MLYNTVVDVTDEQETTTEKETKLGTKIDQKEEYGIDENKKNEMSINKILHSHDVCGEIDEIPNKTIDVNEMYICISNRNEEIEEK